MNQKELANIQGTTRLIAWRPLDHRGIARVRIIRSGVSTGRINQRTGVERFDGDAEVEIVSAVGDLPASGRHDVLTRELEEWTQEHEREFGLRLDRDSFVSDMRELAALAGIALAGVEPISGRVHLTGDEFRRLCESLVEESYSDEEVEGEVTISDVPPEAPIVTDPPQAPQDTAEERAAKREAKMRAEGMMP